MLKVVQHQQQPAGAQNVREVRRRVRAGNQGQTKPAQRRRPHLSHVRDVGQRHDANAVGVVVRERSRRFHRQPCFADAAKPNDGQQPAALLGEPRRDDAQFALAANKTCSGAAERGDRRRDWDGRRGQGHCLRPMLLLGYPQKVGALVVCDPQACGEPLGHLARWPPFVGFELFDRRGGAADTRSQGALREIERATPPSHPVAERCRSFVHTQDRCIPPVALVYPKGRPAARLLLQQWECSTTATTRCS